MTEPEVGSGYRSASPTPFTPFRVELPARWLSLEQFEDILRGNRLAAHARAGGAVVLLSTWLMAQQNTGCAANAKVSMYSIQPGTAYTPANYSGTAFSTDPGYTATDATLINYKNLTTCP